MNKTAGLSNNTGLAGILLSKSTRAYGNAFRMVSASIVFGSYFVPRDGFDRSQFPSKAAGARAPHPSRENCDSYNSMDRT